MVIMESLGQASGVPVQFSAPPPPTPAATPAATPVSMKVHFSLVLCIYVALRAVCGCRRSCYCGCRRSCRCFLQVLETSLCRGGAAEIFNRV